MTGMDWLWDRHVWRVVGIAVLALMVLFVVTALLTRALVKFGLRTPFVISRINRLRDELIARLKRPVTIMVLDEVADVIQTGHYTRNISQAIVENHDELKLLVTDKVRHDPNLRLVGRLPGYDRLVGEIAETTLRVLIEMLGDPRMDELVADLLRNNLEQIKRAVREQRHENVEPHRPPDLPVEVTESAP